MSKITINGKELIVGFNSIDNPSFVVGTLYGYCHNMFIMDDGCETRFIVRLVDFDSNNMEETKKHILCVKKNNQIVKYN